MDGKLHERAPHEDPKSDSLKAALAALPKGDRHNHLCLCVSRRSLLARYGCVPDFPAAYDGLQGMEDFIHAEVNAFMTTGDDVIAFMEMAILDSLLFDATITDQYLALLDAGIFTFDEIETMRLNGLGSEYREG